MKKTLLLFSFLFCFFIININTYAMDKGLILQMINEERAENGAQPLEYSAELETAACIRAEEAKDVWSHSRPDGSNFYTVNKNIVYGEILGRNFMQEDKLLTAWKNSASHHKTMTGLRYNKVGIGICQNKYGKFVIAVELGL